MKKKKPAGGISTAHGLLHDHTLVFFAGVFLAGVFAAAFSSTTGAVVSFFSCAAFAFVALVEVFLAGAEASFVFAVVLVYALTTALGASGTISFTGDASFFSVVFAGFFSTICSNFHC